MKKLLSAFLLIGLLINPTNVFSQEQEQLKPTAVVPIPMICYDREDYEKLSSRYQDLVPAFTASSGKEDKMKMILFVSPSKKQALLVNRVPAGIISEEVLYCVVTAMNNYEVIPIEKIEKSDPS